MNILVPIKRVPDYQAKVKVKGDGSGIETEGIKWIVNPFDEIAVEEALRLREAGKVKELEIQLIGSHGKKVLTISGKAVVPEDLSISQSAISHLICSVILLVAANAEGEKISFAIAKGVAGDPARTTHSCSLFALSII